MTVGLVSCFQLWGLGVVDSFCCKRWFQASLTEGSRPMLGHSTLKTRALGANTRNPAGNIPKTSLDSGFPMVVICPVIWYISIWYRIFGMVLDPGLPFCLVIVLLLPVQ